jgi:hypothetical protein
VSDNIDYIRKSGMWENDKKHDTQIKGSFEEFGTRPSDTKGTITEMKELYDMIVEDGLSNADIIKLNPDYIMQIDKLDKVRQTVLIDRYKNTRRTDLRVIYIYGFTGTGKTRSVLDTYSDENIFRVCDYTHPFDAYCCQPIMVFDEFRQQLPLSDMLQYTDIYPIELKARYNNKFACYNKCYMISNWRLEKQYEDEQHSDVMSWNAFLRRIHEVHYFDNKGMVIVYHTVEKYLNRHSSDCIEGLDYTIYDSVQAYVNHNKSIQNMQNDYTLQETCNITDSNYQSEEIKDILNNLYDFYEFNR